MRIYFGTAKWEDSESKPPATAGEVVVEQIVAATRWAGHHQLRMELWAPEKHMNNTP